MRLDLLRSGVAAMRIRCNPEKRLVRSVGFRIGYWYCIPSPFLQVNVMKRYLSFWVEMGEKDGDQ